MKNVIIALLFMYTSVAGYCQGYVDQLAIAPIAASQQGDIGKVNKVDWYLFTYTDLESLQQYIDGIPGGFAGSRRYIVELANRITFDNLKKGRTLLIPRFFEEDYRAYSPYPFIYEIALRMPKLFIIDKYTQTFAAYEYGRLVRWGLVSTGKRNNLTPAGRYNFNWKTQYRKSNAAPPGEVWEMYWVYNFHAKFGIHLHQYALPIGMAASHGCVRTAEPDAIWNYNWANGWVQDKKGRIVKNGTPLMVINSNPPVRPAQWKTDNNEIVSQVHLPLSFDEVKAGTTAQKEAAWESGW